MARLNRPSLMVYGGTIRAGSALGKPRDIISAFQSYGEYLAGHDHRRAAPRHRPPFVSGRRRLRRDVHGQHDGRRHRGARTVAAVQLVACRPRIRARLTNAAAPAPRLRTLLERDLKPRDILTRKSFENAMTMVMAVGGSTNAVLHLLAIAKAARRAAGARRLPARQRSRAAARRPEAERHVRAGRSARGRRHAGGDEVPARARLPARRLHDGDRQDAGGEPRRRPRRSSAGQEIIQTIEAPVLPRGHIRILHGQPRAGRLGRQDHRQGRRALRRHGEGLRLGRSDARRARDRRRSPRGTSS